MATQLITPAAAPVIDLAGKRKVDVSRGTSSTMLADAIRGADQIFNSIDELGAALRARWDRSQAYDIERGAIRFTKHADTGRLVAVHQDLGEVGMNSWAYEQLCRQIGAPADYLNTLPVSMQAACLQHTWADQGRDDHQLFIDTSAKEMRAITSVNYGRIPDHAMVAQLGEILGRGNVEWKVPGTMDWAAGAYDPDAIGSGTLGMGERDCFIFLCADRDAIQVGYLDDGSPDLVFRAFFARNSEVGAYKFEIVMMLLRGVCENRCLWGMETMMQVSMQHRRRAPERFADEILPALDAIADMPVDPIVASIKAAQTPVALLQGDKETTPAEAQIKFLVDQLKFTKGQAKAIVAHDAPGTPRVESMWDLMNKATSYAQTADFADDRFAIEAKASKLLQLAG